MRIPHLPILDTVDTVMCPPYKADHDAAHIRASHHEQGWVLLDNGVIVFDDGGEILPDRTVIPAHRPEVHLPAVAA